MNPINWADVWAALKNLISVIMPPEIKINPMPQPPELRTPQPILWDSPKNIWHAVRVYCDTVGLTFAQKNILCACIWQESQFYRFAVSPPNKDGTKDYGLCQFNNGHSPKTGQPYWIGQGALFSSIQDVFDHPERAAHTMIMYYKHTGHLNLWSSYKTGAYKKHLPLTSPMWHLAEK